MADDAWMTEPVEVEEPPALKRRRRKYRRYPKPVRTPERKAALWEHHKGI